MIFYVVHLPSPAQIMLASSHISIFPLNEPSPLPIFTTGHYMGIKPVTNPLGIFDHILR